VESLSPGPYVKFPEQIIPGQQKSLVGDTPQPSPIYGKGPLKTNLMILDILPTNRPDPQSPDTRGEGVVVGAVEPGGDPTLKLGHSPPSVDLELGHPENEMIPEQNIPSQQKPIGGDTPQPGLIYGEGLLKANLMILDILPTNRPDPQALETRGEGEVTGAEEPEGDPPSEQVHNSPSVDLELGHLENENSNFPQTMLTFLKLSQGRMEELTSLLSELIGTPLTTEMICK